MTNFTIAKKLPSTAETESGPGISMKKTGLTITYDTTSPSGTANVTLHFSHCAGFKWLPDFETTDLMNAGYSAIVEPRESDWLTKFGSHAPASDLVPREKMRHFAIFFDHFGGIEVLARGFKVDGAEVSDPS